MLNWYADAKDSANVFADVIFTDGNRIKFSLWLGTNEVYHGNAEFWRHGEHYSASIEKVIEHPVHSLDQSKLLVRSWLNKHYHYLENGDLFNLFNGQ